MTLNCAQSHNKNAVSDYSVFENVLQKADLELLILEGVAMLNLKTIAMGLMISAISSQAFAASDAEEQIKTRMKEVLGDDVVVNAISPSKLPDIYEVVFNNSKVVYMTKDARYVIEGDVLDLDTRQNLTEDRRAIARSDSFKALDTNQLIEFSPANPKHTLYVYTDIDCGYCRKFHTQVSKLNANGIAVRYLAFPRDGIDSEAYVAAQSAWCADNKKQALTDAKAGKAISPKTCDSRVKDQYMLGQAMGVRGTPSVFLETGQEMGGYIPADDLINYFNGGL